VASTCQSPDRRDEHEVTGNELSAIQQEGEQSKVNTTISGRPSEEQHLTATSETDFDEITNAKSGEASKGKTRRAHNLRSSDKSNNFLGDCTIASSPSRADMDFIYRLPKQQRDQYAPLKSREVLPRVDGVARHDLESPECANRQGTKRKGPERDGCTPYSQTEDKQQQQQQQQTQITPTPPNPPLAPSRKRCGPPAESHVPSPKRLRGSSRVSARKGRKTKETSACSDSLEVETLRHAFPRHRGNQWDVVDLGRISVEEDGSLSCELLWAPTTVLVSSLKGALLERAEAVVKRDHGVETWGKWLELQGKTGQRRRW